MTITIYVVAKVKKINPSKMLDMVAPGVMIGQAIGRWGNFTNAEAHGVETKLPWRMGIMYAGSTVTKYYHPTFLYESLWNLLGFILIMCFYKKKRFNGQIVLSYITWYGFGRFFIEGLRTDSLYFMKSVFGETIRVSQVVGALCFIFGIVFLIIGNIRAKDRALDDAEYERVYSADHDILNGTASSGKENFTVKTVEKADVESAPSDDTTPDPFDEKPEMNDDDASDDETDDDTDK